MPEGGCVWVVDDSPLELEMARRVLSASYDVRTFADGPALIERLSERRSPDVVVLDWTLPGMSGLEVCRFLRGKWDEIELPVLMLTVRGQKADILEGLGAGANDYLAKPYDENELLGRVRTLVRVRQLHERVRRAEDEARKRAEFERYLAGIVSHDLQNPMNSILLGTELLLRASHLGEAERSIVKRIRDSVERSSRLTRDLLDFTEARIREAIPIQRGNLDFHAVTQQVLDEVQPSFPGRQLVYLATGDGTGEWDAGRLAQVISNLVTNALRYSPEGTLVRVETRGERDEVVLSVHNAGTPIPADLLERLFSPLERGVLENKARRGIGLGLFIVSKIVRAHGGSISVDSSPESGGTTFQVRMPRHPRMEQSAAV